MTKQNGASVDLIKVSKFYGTQEVLPEVSLSIAPGEFVSFLGPSGSGKSTTLNIIAGFTDLTGGDVMIAGKSIAQLAPHRRDLGMVFQHYALFPHLTIAENIAFPLRRRKIAKAEIKARVAEALDLVGLSDRADAYPKQLSGGQQQRVAFARAIVYRPRVLLMDEPLGALDKKLREHLQYEIKKLHRDLGITFIFVTHDQEEALTLSDRIVVFDKGRIVQVGTGPELYEQPKSRFVAEFIGEVNILAGQRPSRYATMMKVDGHELHTGPSEHTGACVIVLRPEKIRLTYQPVQIEGTKMNHLSGTVINIDYFGSTRRVCLSVPGFGSNFVVREALDGNSPSFALGDRVNIGWEATSGAILPDI